MTVQTISETTIELRAVSGDDVRRFIETNASQKDDLTVRVDTNGIGDYWADMLTEAGFRVTRSDGRNEPSVPSV